MTKIVFHLGDRKSGSTAIQSTLSSGAWKCDSVKLQYPLARTESHYALAKCVHGIGRQADMANQPDAARLFGDVVARIKAASADVAIISSEHFEEVDPVVLKAAIQTFMPEFADTARYIAYVRPHAERIASSFSERVKQGAFFGSMEELHRQSSAGLRFTYTQRFLKWRAAFGPAFELRPMIRDLVLRKDVVADFLHFALQTEDFSLAAAPDSNDSLSLENLAIVRQLQLRLRAGQEKYRDYQTAIGRALARRMNDSAYRDGTRVRIHKALAEQVRDHYAEDAAALDAAFFKGTPMTDALNTAPDKAEAAAQSVRIEDHFSDREQYLINTFVDQTAVLINADPDFLAEKLRTEHRSKVIADEDHDEAEKPVRRRGGKGGKGGRRANAGAEVGAVAEAGAAIGSAKGKGKGAGKAGAKPGGRRAGAGWANRVKPTTTGEE